MRDVLNMGDAQFLFQFVVQVLINIYTQRNTLECNLFFFANISLTIKVIVCLYALSCLFFCMWLLDLTAQSVPLLTTGWQYCLYVKPCSLCSAII